MGLVSDSDFVELLNRVKEIEKEVRTSQIKMKEVVKQEFSDRQPLLMQSENQFGLYTALCVDTIDIWKQNRIRFFCPAFHNPRRPIKELPWAYPVANMGGFDDCGSTWVPPAGSTVCILFEAGQRSSPYYIGTTWHRDRGADGQHNWGFNIDEYYKIWEGRRNGYLVGPDDGSQVLPPWNTENYNGFDLSSIVDFASNPEAQRRITYPHIYGWKTPEKHMIKMVDGDHKCNRRWKRFELMSSCGNWIMMKDDHLHYAGQWAHPSCGGVVRDGDTSCIQGVSNNDVDITRFQGLSTASAEEASNVQNSDNNVEGETLEETTCGGRIIGGQPNNPTTSEQVGANPYFKSESECRPYRGPGTPQNNTVDLPQTGFQVMSISGHTLVMDDSVSKPSGDIDWDRSTRDFDFGCDNVYQGRTYWKSATGHLIEMSDIEVDQPDSMLRGEKNYIRLLSAGGNIIELNDHTESQPGCEGCPPNVAGARRGVFIGSTSGHSIELNDEANEQCGPCRKELGRYDPVSRAKKAFVKIRSGYGIEIAIEDKDSQTETSQQSLQFFCPQKDNTDRGPHLMRFQESASGPGQVFLRSGGNYIVTTYDEKIEVVGDEAANPADNISINTKMKMVYTKDMYINVTEKSQIFIAKDKIMLLAGRDASNTEGEDCGPATGPVLVYAGGSVLLSDRVYATTSLDAPQCSIFMLSPLTQPGEPSVTCDSNGTGEANG